MKRKTWIIVTVCLAVVLVAAACLIGWATYRGIQISKAVYIETSAGNMVLLQGSPVSVSGKEDMFDGLTMGDKVLLVHGLVAESYPGKTKGYFCIKRADGTEEDIPAEVRDSLREMGWLLIYLVSPEVWENEPSTTGDALDVQEYAAIKVDYIEMAKTEVDWEYYAVTTEQDTETGNFLISFSSRDRKKIQVVIVEQLFHGWKMYAPVNQDEAIAMADAYKIFDYYAATAEQDPETDNWTVMFWSQDRETFQEVIIGQYVPLLDGP